jgi:hypothetical protein
MFFYIQYLRQLMVVSFIARSGFPETTKFDIGEGIDGKNRLSKILIWNSYYGILKSFKNIIHNKKKRIQVEEVLIVHTILAVFVF